MKKRKKTLIRTSITSESCRTDKVRYIVLDGRKGQKEIIGMKLHLEKFCVLVQLAFT